MYTIKIIRGFYKRNHTSMILMLFSAFTITLIANVLISNLVTSINIPSTDLVLFQENIANYNKNLIIEQKQIYSMDDNEFVEKYGIIGNVSFDLGINQVLTPHSETIYQDILNNTGPLMILPNTYDESMIYNAPNFSLGVQQLIVGKLPETDNQIAINEVLAQSYANSLDSSSINQLIGNNINVEINNHEEVFEISGIYSGDFTALITPKQFSKYSNDYESKKNTMISFSSENEKKQFIKDNSLTPDEYIDSSYNTINYKLVVIIIWSILVITIFILSNINLVSDLQILSYYYPNRILLLYGIQPFFIGSLALFWGHFIGDLF